MANQSPALCWMIPGAAAIQPRRGSTNERIEDALALATRALNSISTATSEEEKQQARTEMHHAHVLMITLYVILA